jgi:hypothetical protein
VSNENADQVKAALRELNQQFGNEEQRGEDGKPFFELHLSNRLLFRRASGKVVGKTEFLGGLANNPFESRTTEEISVHVDGDRALVTLIVVGTLKADKSVHRYRNVRFFTQEGNRWLLDAWYNYEVTGL